MLDRALLGFTPLRCALLGYNFAGLCWTLLNYTTLDHSKLICTELDYALLGYNFALLNYLSHCSACLYYTLLRCVRI